MGIFSRTPKHPVTPPAASIQPPRSAPQTDAGVPQPTRLVVNTLVQAALRAWGAKKDAQTMNGVLRQCVTGELLLDISGSTFADASKGFQAGDRLGIGQVVDNAGARLLLVFTSNDELQAYRPDRAPMSLAQPASGAMQQALNDFDGAVIDPASPHSCIIYAAEIQRGLTETPGVNEPVKRALVAGEANERIRDAAASAPMLFVGVTETRDEAGDVTGVAIPSVTTKDGERCSLAFTSPAEAWAFDPGFSIRTIGLDAAEAHARSNGYDAVMLDPMGPWALLRVQDRESD